MDRQCSSCGGFCKKSGCERENVRPEVEQSNKSAYQRGYMDGMAKRRDWIGLTLEDKQEYMEQDFGGNRLDAMDWAARRLKEKNTHE